MPNPRFPLAQRPRRDLEISLQDVRVRTTVDFGPPKMRPRYTSATRYWRGTLRQITGVEKTILETWHASTLGHGSLPFDWPDENGATAAFRFVDSLAFRVSRPHADAAKRLYDMPLGLEILP